VIFPISELPPFKPDPLPIPGPRDEPFASTLEFTNLRLTILESPPFDSPIPMPVRPRDETDEFTNKTDPHMFPELTPIPGALVPPFAYRNPPSIDEIVMFDSTHSTGA
jgi:hypothetical protein